MKKIFKMTAPCSQELFHKTVEEVKAKSLEPHQPLLAYHFPLSEGVEMAIEYIDNDFSTVYFDAEKNLCVVVDPDRDYEDFDYEEDEEIEKAEPDDEIILIRQIKANPQRYLEFPKIFSHAVYDWMLEFSEDQSHKIQWALKDALVEEHPMSAFNQVATEHAVYTDWLNFQYEKKSKVIEWWLKRNQIAVA